MTTEHELVLKFRITTPKSKSSQELVECLTKLASLLDIQLSTERAAVDAKVNNLTDKIISRAGRAHVGIKVDELADSIIGGK